jgi:RimJ/RimL family protein N-acetyltransferase
MPITIRPITLDDAAAITALFAAIDRESKFLLFEPGERTQGPDEWRRRIEQTGGDGANAIFVAADDQAAGELVGVLIALGDARQRLRHSAALIVAVRQAYAGQGIATRLFAAAEAWARGRGLHRLYLQVQANNHRAVALYHRWGFTVEGFHRHAVRLDGAWVDDYTMAKLLE